MRTTKEVVIHLNDGERITIRGAGTEAQIGSLGHLGYMEVIMPDRVSGMVLLDHQNGTREELTFASLDDLHEEVERLRLITFTPEHPYTKDGGFKLID